jgi:nicotinamidase-related amidase
MKKKIFSIILLIISVILPSQLFSQVQEEESPKKLIKPALLVIDIQNAYLKSIPEADREPALANINNFITLFRSYGYPVIRIFHRIDEYGVKPGTQEFEFPASVLSEPFDPKIIKTYPDAFNKTDLDKVIKEQGCNTLFLCGLSAVGCVLATWIGADNHDYDAFLIKDAIMSHNSQYTDNVEVMFDAVGYDIVKLILENSEKEE